MDKHEVFSLKRQDLQNLLAMAECLYQSILSEVNNESWRGYNSHLASYHDILLKVYQIGISKELMPIQPIKHKYRGLIISSNEEKAALLEILQKTLLLCDSLSQEINQTYSIKDNDIEWAISRVTNICDKFHLLVMQLKRGFKTTEIVRNEYDIQHLFRTFLSFDFDDIRSEEYTPSYAGGSARMDFLILPYGIVVETKMTRENLKDRQIGEELLVDFARYQKHNHCSSLICFIYDPENHISNAAGLIELEREGADKLMKKIYIRPSGK